MKRCDSSLGILPLLAEAYPDAATELHFENEYQLVVAVILSAQCTDKKVNEITPSLFKAYSSFATLASAPLAALESIVRPINYYRTKARNLREMARLVTDEHDGVLPRAHDKLLALPGVGRKTANVVLGELGAQETFPVDTHVFRVSRRLGLSTGSTVEKVEKDLMAAFPPRDWRSLHHRLILHGRRVCKAQRPACSLCTLAKKCPSSRVRADGSRSPPLASAAPRRRQQG